MTQDRRAELLEKIAALGSKHTYAASQGEKR